MTQMYFIIGGGFGLYNPAVKEKGTHTNNNPFVIMKRHSIFGDYQLMFDLYPMMQFSPFGHSNITPKSVIAKLGEDAEVDVHNVMCLEGEIFENLCDLYPDSKQTIAHASLKKRKLFMDKLEE